MKTIRNDQRPARLAGMLAVLTVLAFGPWVGGAATAPGAATPYIVGADISWVPRQ